MGVPTVDCTIEHIISRKARIVVDSGTHAGIHVPVCVFCSILWIRMKLCTARRGIPEGQHLEIASGASRRY